MYINNSAIKRIAKDVKYIITNEESLSSENIYIINMMKKMCLKVML
jgi:hypothetical protein